MNSNNTALAIHVHYTHIMRRTRAKNLRNYMMKGKREMREGKAESFPLVYGRELKHESKSMTAVNS